MKMRCLLLFGTLLIQACTENHTGHSGTLAAAPVVQAANEKACLDLAAPNMNCSQTVTATFGEQGTLWVAWVQNEHIFVQSSPDKGATFSAPVQVNPIAEPVIAHDEYRPKIQLDKQGNIYLTWTRSLEKRHTGHIRFSRSLDGGKTFSAPVTVNDNLAVISHRFDSLSVGQNGEIFVAWLDARDKVAATAKAEEFLGTSLYYAWSDDRGESFHPNQLATPHTCECCRLGTVIGKDNLPMLMWRHVFPGNVRDHAFMKFENWGRPGEIAKFSDENWKIEGCPHHGPAVALADDGRFHTVWFSGAESRQGLYYANVKDVDQPLSRSAQMHFGGESAKHPNIAVLGNRVAIAWLEFDGSNTLVKLMQSFDGGAQWTEPKQIGQSAESADYAFVVADQGELYLSWQTRRGYRFKALADLY